MTKKCIYFDKSYVDIMWITLNKYIFSSGEILIIIHSNHLI